MKKIQLTIAFALISYAMYAQKTTIAIADFKSSEGRSYYSNRSNPNEKVQSLQEMISDEFTKTKRFTIVERGDGMKEIETEQSNQKDEKFIDGETVNAKAKGAQFLIVGTITELTEEEGSSVANGFTALAGVGTSIKTKKVKVAFSMKVIDVATTEVVASQTFSEKENGKNAYDEILGRLRPQLSSFINENFKIMLSIAQLEAKVENGDAKTVLLAGGSSQGLKPNTNFKVFELSEMEVDGKKLTRKKQIGKISIATVEDENFSMCNVVEGGADIAKKLEAGAKLKCEIIQ